LKKKKEEEDIQGGAVGKEGAHCKEEAR